MGFLAKRRAEEAARSAALAKERAQRETERKAVAEAEAALSPLELLKTPAWEQALASVGGSIESALFVAEARGGEIVKPGGGEARDRGLTYVAGLLVILDDGRLAYLHRSIGEVGVAVRRTDEIKSLRGSKSGRNFYVDFAVHIPDPRRRIMLGMVGKEDYWQIPSPPLPGSPSMGDHDYWLGGFEAAGVEW